MSAEAVAVSTTQASPGAAAPGVRLDPDVRDAVLLGRIARLDPVEIGYILGVAPAQVERWQVQGSHQIADDEWGTR